MIEMIIAVTLLSVVLLSVATLNLQSVRQTESMLTLSEVKIFRLKLIEAIKNNQAWRRTISQPVNALTMSCLRQPNGVCPYVGYNPGTNPRFAVFNAAALDDETYYSPSGPSAGALFDATVATNGITAKGKKCTGFSAITSTPNCPLRFNLRWYALSNTPSPLIAVYANLQISPNTLGNINPNNYSIGFFIGNVLSSPIVRTAQ